MQGAPRPAADGVSPQPRRERPRRPKVFGQDARPAPLGGTWRLQENPAEAERERYPLALYLGDDEKLSLSRGAAADLLQSFVQACRAYPVPPETQGAKRG